MNVNPVTITLEGIPVGKGRPRMSTWHGKIRAYTPPATRSYEDSLKRAAAIEMKGRELFDGPVSVTLRAVYPIPKSWTKAKRAAAVTNAIKPTVKPDLDNVLKTLDAFNGIVWHDDSQIVSGTINKVYGVQPLIAVTVTPA